MRHSGKTSRPGKSNLLGDDDVGYAAGLSLSGTAGDDVIDGSTDDDTFAGLEGADRLPGGGGIDTLSGGGDDLVYDGIGLDRFYRGSGEDRLYGDAGDVGAVAGSVIAGTSGRDTLVGTAGDDTLQGGGGDDKLYGEGGSDVLYGGSDDDRLYGGDGDDDLRGGSGNDSLFGDAGNDTLSGGSGDDLLKGRDDNDTLYGDDGDDQLYGEAGDDWLYGGEGADTLIGDDGSDRLYGDAGDDLLNGGAGDDRLEGGKGDDELRGGDGADSLYGDAGNDALFGGAGDDLVKGRIGNDRLYGDAGNDQLYGDAGSDRLYGGGGDDLLEGGDGADSLYGDAGDDTLYGGNGDDLLRGRGDNDTLFGETGDDRLYGDAGDDRLSGGSGRDTLIGGDGIDRLFGGDDDDVLKGGDGDDNLYGDAGNDRLDGDAGNDRIDGGDGTDTAVFSGNFADYELEFSNGYLRISGGGETDRLINIERIDFADQRITLDPAPGNTDAPVFTSASSANVEENQTAAYTAVATDGQALSYFLGGTDAGLFDIDRATGVVTFTAAPNYEAPADVGGDNVYDIVVRAFDGANTSDHAVAIAVTDVSDNARVVDVTGLAPSEGFVILSSGGGGSAGVSVGSAGDINGDGFDDIVLGLPAGYGEGPYAGAAYVLFGSASGFGTLSGGSQILDLRSLTAQDGFLILGTTPYQQAGWSVSTAGDVNGDGFADIIIGANVGDDGGEDSGQAYVVFGKAGGFGTIDLSTLSASQGFVIQGDEAGDVAGHSVASAGDINGDGYDDLMVGASRGDDGGHNAGEAYVVFGSGAGFGSSVGGRRVVDLTGLALSDGFVIQGDYDYDSAGISVGSAGDLNGDGLDDLIVGASGGQDGGGFHAGEAYVIFGRTSGFSRIDLTSLSASDGFIIQGDTEWDYAGWSVSSAGDVNGDGFDDVVVGARGAGVGSYTGESYVVFGGASGFGTDVDGRQVIDLTSLSAIQGFVIQGEGSGDEAGRSVSSAGDINGDGYDDLIIGAPRGDTAGTDSGQAYVVFGSASGFGVNIEGRQVLDLSHLQVDEGFVILGDDGSDRLGSSVSAAGDMNQDGYDDVIVSAPRAYFLDSFGVDYVIFGSATGSTSGMTSTGTAGANTMIGSAGDDTLIGAGGADVIRGGAGDDVIGVSDNGFFRIDGGNGEDTLRLDGSGIDLDFTAIAQNTVTGIERIDLTGSGDNSLTLTALDVFDMMDARENGVAVLRVDGDAGDTVNLTGGAWVSAGSIVEGATTYDRYTSGNAEVRVESTVSVPGAAPLDPGKIGGDTVVMGVIDPAIEGSPFLLSVDDGALAAIDGLARVTWHDGFRALVRDTPWGDRDHDGFDAGLRGGAREAFHSAQADSLADYALAVPDAAATSGFVSLSEREPAASLPVADGVIPDGLILAAFPGILPAGGPFDVAFLPAETPFDLPLPDPVEGWH